MDSFKWEMSKQATAIRVIRGNVMLPESERRLSPILKRASEKACLAIESFERTLLVARFRLKSNRPIRGFNYLTLVVCSTAVCTNLRCSH